MTTKKAQINESSTEKQQERESFEARVRILKSKLSKNIKTNISFIRNIDGISQSDLQEKTGVSLPSIKINIEGKESNITLQQMLKLAVGLKIHWCLLFMDNDGIDMLYDLVNDFNEEIKKSDEYEYPREEYKNYLKSEMNYTDLLNLCESIAVDDFGSEENIDKETISNLYLGAKLGVEAQDKEKFILSMVLSQRLAKVMSDLDTNN